MKKLLLLILTFCFSYLFFAEQITFSAEEMSGQANNTASVTILEGNAFIQTQDMEIRADRIELSGENYRNIKAEGHVAGKSVSSQMDFNCNILEFDRETNVAL